MDLVKSWAVAVAVGLAAYGTYGMVLVTVIRSGLLAPTPVNAFIMLQLPAFVLPGLMAAVGALMHPLPRGGKAGRHVWAVLLVPGLSLAANLVYGVAQQKTPMTLALGFVVGAVGAVVGWQLADFPRRRARKQVPASSY